MGSTDFDDIGKCTRFFTQRLCQGFKLRNELLAQCQQRRNVHRRRKDIVGTLAFVHVVVRVNFTFHPAHTAE
ncbi:Uncharacterised protein [Shigella flexneri]|nr:Uncharacterised protein [Shigella flexneri]